MITVIVVNYHKDKLLYKCIESLQKQSISRDQYEIIIIDNDSRGGIINHIKNEMKSSAKIETLKHNAGFTGGNIEGLRHAKGDYIILLNNDTEVEDNWLENLIKPFAKDPQIGICASKMIIYGTEKIDSAGDGCTNTARGYKIGEGRHFSQHNESKYVFGACGGAVAYRREMLDETGFLDDDFFLIHEDTDMNFRAQLMGWKCMFVHDAVVYHKVRSTIGEMSNLAVYYSVRNAEYVWLKNMPLGLIIKYLPHKIIQEFGGIAYFCIKNKKYKPYFEAKLDIIKNIPKCLKKRKEIQGKKRVSNQYIDGLLTNILSKEIITSKLKKFKDTSKSKGAL
ncbi:hypothetical protein SAMN05660297_01705 [Natronincola peptidivorans]|uniref:Glycosyltransferase 2-like domain-containing protein n=1 Tax=Natronincola peptidivorans TaxID=426128 RepID=A0A1I0CPX7_9FIRM|nr:glycosyltransferase family 2 protein [Natronincola peptidivorans]SET21709.1 hypothetical protein SAMN05660297_01705 [Natronincola peptidivorans]